MALGINETIESQVYRSKHLVYKEGVYVKYPSKDKEILACILPSLVEGEPDKGQYAPYRNPDDPRFFSKWAVGLKMHPFVNKEQNIISPQSIDPQAFDPIDELIRVAKMDPEYCILAGFGTDGKRIQNAYKNPEVRLSSVWRGYVANVLIQSDREIDSKKAVLLQIPGTAFARGGKSGSDGSQNWGLLAELNRKNRNANGSKGSDMYYWGDITDPRGMVPCSLALTPNPAGGIPIYNMVPTTEIETVRASLDTLKTRYDLDKVFYEITEGEIIDRLVTYFGDVPKLLIKTFAGRVPNFEGLLRRSGATHSTPVKVQDDDDSDETQTAAFVSRPAKRAQARQEEEETEATGDNARDFAPAEDDLPPPVVKRAVQQPEEENEDEKEITVPVRRTAGRKVSIKDLLD